jgi:molybdate transport system substrate-binding protein
MTANMRPPAFSAIVCWLLSTVLLTASLSPAQEKRSQPELLVAAAADLSSALTEVSDNYQKQSGVEMKLSFAGSGTLTQQIQSGAPFDIFFSADMDYPRQLIAAGDADGATLYQYVVGKLVLWVPDASPLDIEHQCINALRDPSVKRISLANPQHAPYGRAAIAALKYYHLYKEDELSGRLVLGENVAQAAQFAESGNAQVGFIALAHALSPAMRGKGKYCEVPQEAYPPLAQGVVILTHAKHKKEAADFLRYIKTKDATEVLRKYGFSVQAQ